MVKDIEITDPGYTNSQEDPAAQHAWQPHQEAFKKKYNLVDANAKVLRTPAEKFNFADPQMDAYELANDLASHMKHFGGVGLAAPQLGIPIRAFVMNGDPLYVVFNPVITGSHPDEVLMDEGCLSFPGLYLKIKRPSTVRVRFQDYNGDTHVKKFGGMTARVFQHEYEHMIGEVFVDHVSDFARNRAIDKQRKLLNKVRKQLKQANKQIKTRK
jgi:peptide deformylase